MNHLTGAQVRALLDDFNNPRTPIGNVPVRALLETLAWLYGKEPALSWPRDNESAYQFGRSDDGDWHRVSVWQNEQAVGITVTDTLNPDQAEELARALLAAAEKARIM